MCSFAETTRRSARIFLLTAGFSAVAAPVPARSQFEGIIRSANITTDETGAQHPFTMVMWIKPGKLRVESSPAGDEPGSLVIHRADLRLHWVLNAADRSYIEVRHMPEQGGRRGERDGQTPALKRTGAARRILGYRAVQLVASDGELETELWGATELEPVARAIATAVDAGSGGEAPGGITQDVAELGMFPLVARIRVGGNLVEESLVTSVQRTGVADSMFVLPAGFRRQVMDEMFDVPMRR